MQIFYFFTYKIEQQINKNEYFSCSLLSNTTLVTWADIWQSKCDDVITRDENDSNNLHYNNHSPAYNSSTWSIRSWESRLIWFNRLRTISNWTLKIKNREYRISDIQILLLLMTTSSFHYLIKEVAFKHVISTETHELDKLWKKFDYVFNQI